MRALQELNSPRDGNFYICGPPTFMSDLTAGLTALGVAPDRIHTEMFGAGGIITPGIVAGPNRPPINPQGRRLGTDISFVRSGLNVRWGRASAASSSWRRPATCRCDGRVAPAVCHTCETGLLDGTVDYSPEPLEAPADGNLLVCCSHPEGDVVIDL